MSDRPPTREEIVAYVNILNKRRRDEMIKSGHSVNNPDILQRSPVPVLHQESYGSSVTSAFALLEKVEKEAREMELRQQKAKEAAKAAAEQEKFTSSDPQSDPESEPESESDTESDSEPSPKQRKLNVDGPSDPEPISESEDEDEDFQDDDDDDDEKSESSESEAAEETDVANDVIRNMAKKQLEEINASLDMSAFTDVFVGRLGKTMEEYDSENDVKVARKFMTGLECFMIMFVNRTKPTHNPKFNAFAKKLADEVIGPDDWTEEYEKTAAEGPDSDAKMAFYLSKDVVMTLYAKRKGSYRVECLENDEKRGVRDNVEALFAGINAVYEKLRQKGAKTFICMKEIQDAFTVFLNAEDKAGRASYFEEIQFMRKILV